MLPENRGQAAERTDTSFELSIIVVNWNTKELLADCLRSIYTHTSNLSFEVIVVDNASVDGSPEMVAADFPQATLIRNHQNLGFGRANNQGFALARGKYIGLLNSDAALLNEAFEVLVKCLDSRSSVGIIGPILLKEDGSVDRACARGFITLKTEFLSATGLTGLFPGRFSGAGQPLLEYENSQSVDCLSGACLLIRREALDKNRIFDPTFFMYGEDVDLCYGVKARGWKVYYCSAAKVLHRGKASTNQNPVIPLYALHSHNMFVCKAYGKGAGLIHRSIWFFTLIVRYLITLFIWSTQPGFRHQSKWISRRRLYPEMIQWALGTKVIR
ncbi:glycosyltransferase family 2 protein [bacterium]|nr:MAG: glycosyltransferase family 2 protein [bacterium]